jgi:hypothetical protein
VNRDPPKPLRKSGRSRDINKKHEAVFLDRGMISAVMKFRSARGPIILAIPKPRFIKTEITAEEIEPSRKYWLEVQAAARRYHDNRCVDRATRNQMGRERKIAEPTPQRAVEDKQLDAPQGDAHHEPLGYAHDHRRRGVRPIAKLIASSATVPTMMTAASNRSFRSSPAFVELLPASRQLGLHRTPPRCAGHRVGMLSASFRGRASRCRYSMNVVSCAPSSATNTAISSAGSVLLALAETRCVESGGSKNDCPTLNVSTGPPPSCERISPLVI